MGWAVATSTRAKSEDESWEGVDQGLFEHLRELRREIADSRGVPAYVIFGDRSLREMARDRPSTPEELTRIHGVGQKKLDDFMAFDQKADATTILQWFSYVARGCSPPPPPLWMPIIPPGEMSS